MNMNRKHMVWVMAGIFAGYFIPNIALAQSGTQKTQPVRDRILLNENWHFYKYPSSEIADNYLRCKAHEGSNEYKLPMRNLPKPLKKNMQEVLKPWILPTEPIYRG